MINSSEQPQQHCIFRHISHKNDGKKAIMISQEYREDYTFYYVGYEHPKHRKYFVVLSCGYGLSKIRTGILFL